MNIEAWEILALDPGATQKEIRRQYAKLSRQCHPEEEPEKFAELQKAYKYAMDYCKNSDRKHLSIPNEEYPAEHFQMDREQEDNGQEDNENVVPSLVGKLNQTEADELQLYINSGIVKTIVDMLSNPKSRNKVAEWQKLFLSDAFLDGQYTDLFADGLQYIFQSLPEVKNIKEVPSDFLTELAIAYGITVEKDGTYRFGNDIRVERIISSYWNSMPEEWCNIRAAGYLKKAQNQNRARSFANYRMLLSMNEATFFNKSSSLKWQEILWKLGKTYFYESNKAHESATTGSKIFIDLCVYWLSHYKVPDHVVGYVYEHSQLDKIDSMSCGDWYRPLKDCIMTYYPDLECFNNNEQEIRSAFVNEYMNFKLANNKVETAYEEGKTFDKKAFDEKCQAFFESEVWKNHATDVFIEKYLIEKGGVLHLHYDAIEPMFARYYDAEKKYGDTEAALLEQLIRARHFSRQYYGIEEDKRAFFVLIYAFGIRKLSGVKIYDHYGFYGKNEELNFPKYIDYLFVVGESGKYQGEKYEHQFVDGSKLEYKFAYQNVSISWNGREVYGDVLPPWKVTEYAKELSEFRDFAVLLSIMDRKAYTDSDDKQKASVRQCIEEWLMPLELTLNIRDRMIDCILMGVDEIETLGDFVLCESACRKLYVAAEENSYFPYLYFKEGLLRLPEYIGATAATDWESIKKAYDLPSPNLTKVQETKGLSEESIADIIYEGFLLNAQNDPVNGTFYARKYDGNYDVPYIKEYMQREGRFLQNAFVILKRTGQREGEDEVLSISLLGQGVCSLAYYNQFESLSRKLQSKIMREFSEESKTIGWFASQYNQSVPQLIAVGESGNLYIDKFLRNLGTGKSIKDIIKYHIPIGKCERVKVYANILSWDRFQNAFDYSFQVGDYEDPRSLANYFGEYRFSEDIMKSMIEAWEGKC